MAHKFVYLGKEENAVVYSPIDPGRISVCSVQLCTRLSIHVLSTATKTVLIYL